MGNPSLPSGCEGSSIPMAETDETIIVTQPKGEANGEPREEDVLKLGKTFRSACLLNWFKLVKCLGHLVASLSLICKHAESNLPKEQFFLYNIFVPFFVLAIIDIFCTSYYVFALTQNTVRHLYVAVFHVSIFYHLLGILTCVYYLMVFFSPYHIYNILVLTSSFVGPGHTKTLITHLPEIYEIDLSVIFVFIAIDCALYLTLTCSIYFKADKLRIFLSKYWFLRTLLVLALDLFLVHYYVYLILLKYDQGVLGHLIFFIAKTILVVCYLKKQICLPNSFKLKPLDGQKVPANKKLKQAVRIMEMKAEVKEVADSCGRGLSSPTFGVFTAGHI